MQGGVDRTGDPKLPNEVFHAIHVIRSMKLGDHEGLALFVHGRDMKKTLSVVLLAVTYPPPHTPAA